MSARAPSPHRRLLEQRILRAAEHLFAEKGYGGTAMEAVADKANISKQNLIYYFRSKKLLYSQVLQQMLDRWLEKMSFHEMDENSPVDVIGQYIRAKLELARDYPDASKVFAHEIINGAPALKDQLHTQLKPQFDRDVYIINRWREQGLINADVEPEHLFFVIWAATQTYADFSFQIRLLLNKTQLEESDFETATRFLTQLILRGIGADIETDTEQRIPNADIGS